MGFFFPSLRLCSLAQDARQETDDSGNLKKKSIKPEPAVSEEEEAADAKLSSVAGQDEADAKPLLGKP